MEKLKRFLAMTLTAVLFFSFSTSAWAEYSKLNVEKSKYSTLFLASPKPQKVTGLKAIGITYKSFTLKWTKQAGNIKYKIQKYYSAKKTWVNVARDLTSNEYKFENALGATTYVFRVLAYASSKNFASYCSPLTVFTKPKNVTGLKESSVTDNGFKLSWDKVSGATGYLIYKFDAKKEVWKNIAVVSLNYYSVSGETLAANTKFRVRAYKKNGNINTYGNCSSTFESAIRPKKVTGLKIYSSKENDVVITWTKQSGAEGYQVYLYNADYKKFIIYAETTSSACKLKNMPYSTYCRVEVRAFEKYKTARLYGTFSSELSFKIKKPSTQVVESIEVYCNTSSKTYHFDKDCRSLKNVSDEKIKVVFIGDRLDVFEIKAVGYTPCKYCAVN